MKPIKAETHDFDESVLDPQSWVSPTVDHLNSYFSLLVFIIAASGVLWNANNMAEEEVSKPLQTVLRQTYDQVVLGKTDPLPFEMPYHIPQLSHLTPSEQQALSQTWDKLEAFSKDVNFHRITDFKVKKSKSALVIDFGAGSLFHPGHARFTSGGQNDAEKIAEMLKGSSLHVQIAGFTDHLPPSRTKDRFPTNWELSASRASTLLRVFEDKGVAPEKLRAVGYGKTRPAVDREPSNLTSDDLLKNRRIRVTLAPRENLLDDIEMR